MPTVTNIAAYKFARLKDLKTLRQRLLSICREGELKGTILLSTEGINLFIAGSSVEVDRLVTELRRVPGLAELTPKFSESDHQPFNRMLVRIKKEIIAFGVEGIDPATRTSPKLAAATLKQWLDEGRPITLLDTRNDYEVKLGTFKGAKTLPIQNFRQFPEAVSRISPDLKHQPIVMFCTGGIRCEKAGPYMEREGFQQIYQLDGGILKYFEDCGGQHYEGECFVFDQRVGVDPALRETDSTQCYACLTPLNAEDQKDPRYQPPKSCPYCHRSPEEERVHSMAKRQASLDQVAQALPGCHPYENRRPVHISEFHDGWSLLRVLTTVFAHIPEPDWIQMFDQERVVNHQGLPVNIRQVVRSGERYWQIFPATVEPRVNTQIRLLHEDEAIIVLHKPAPLPMHPSGRFNRNTLQFFLGETYAPQTPRPAHRLDANTTGVVVFCRTQHFAKLLQPQFMRGEVEKRYRVRIQGHPAEDHFVSTASIGIEVGEVGSRSVDEQGQTARTEFSVLKRDSDGTALLEARPVTGRTNQIRIHLWQLGFPVIGDPTYLTHGKIGATQTLPLEAPPMCLHAYSLEFMHPVTRQRVRFDAPLPSWAE